MGTRLIARGLDLASDDPALWNLSRPEVVDAVHRLDIRAGSDALVTNTFGANRAWLARFAREGETRKINQRAVAIAREAAGPARFLLGSIGPTAADRPGAYRDQADALTGVDALLLETHTVDRALVGLAEISRGGLPIIVSLFRWDSPEDSARLIDAGANILGANCVSPDVCRSMIGAIRGSVAIPLFAKPTDVSPRQIASDVPNLLRLGVRLIGGCCGTTEAHVAAIRSALDLAIKTGIA